MMGNKFYTPTTQEEVVLYIMDNLRIWTSDTNPTTNEPFELRFNRNAPTALNSLLQIYNVVHFANGSVEYDFSPESFRIKSLDREDIESLGFVHDGERDYGGYRTCYILTINDSIGENRMGYSLTHLYTTNRVIINIHEGYYDGCIFDGNIKNKSELKKALIQVGVLNETN